MIYSVLLIQVCYAPNSPGCSAGPRLGLPVSKQRCVKEGGIGGQAPPPFFREMIVFFKPDSRRGSG